MSDAHSKASALFLSSLSVSIEPDIHLARSERLHLDQCLAHLSQLCHTPVVLHCTLLSLSSFSTGSNIHRESTQINQYLRVRQPRKFYWMRNIKQMYLSIHLPADDDTRFAATLVEVHSCKRLSHAARAVVQQIRPARLVYHVDERVLKLNLRGENCLLQLVFASDVDRAEHAHKGMYFKWSDEGRIRSTTIQFDIDYQLGSL